MSKHFADLRHQLRHDAGTLEDFLTARALAKPSAGANDQSSSPKLQQGNANVETGVAAVTFLLEREALDLGEYPEWVEVGIAFKNSFGEAGYPAWLALSEAANNFESDEDCRKEWDGFKERAYGETKLTIGTYFFRAKELGWKPPRRKSAGGDADTDGGPTKGEDYSAYTVRLADSAGDELWLDQEDRPHVTYVADLPDGGTVKRHLPIEGSGYRAVLESRFYEAAGDKVLKKDQADAAAGLLTMRARQAGVHHVSALRVGEHGGAIYIDLGTPDGAAVEVDATDWRVVAEPPVRFVRGSRGTLPMPQRGGTLATFKKHFNLSTDDLLRAVGFMIGAFSPTGPYPILMVNGDPGSAKSSLGDKVLSITDPPHQFKSGRTSFNTKEQDLHIAAQGVHVMCFDNVSHFSSASADILCRIATGGASGSRKLYTNDQYQQFEVIRPIVLSSIGLPSSRSDLLDRSMVITAEPLSRRRTERVVQAEFFSDRPKLFGVLLSCVSASLRNQAAVDAAVDEGGLTLPRMADFATFVEGAGEVLGLPIGGFSALLSEGQSATQMEAVMGLPVGAALIEYFSRSSAEPLIGSASNVLETLKDVHGKDHAWPHSNRLNSTMQRLSLGLNSLGIKWTVAAASGHDNVAKFNIWATADFQAQDPGPGYDQRDPHNDGAGQF